ncbi:MAG: cupin domain-containing protein [Methyloceanibacter sp.]
MEEPAEKTKPWLDPASVTPRVGSIAPAPFAAPFAGREKRVLGDPLGLGQFGVNLVTLAPGAWSSQRHWHENEDEFVYVLEGEVSLVTGDGETLLRPGMAAGFPAGRPDGHHLINRGHAPARYLEAGTRAAAETAHFSDIDLMAHMRDGKFAFTHKDGTPYQKVPA